VRLRSPALVARPSSHPLPLGKGIPCALSTRCSARRQTSLLWCGRASSSIAPGLSSGRVPARWCYAPLLLVFPCDLPEFSACPPPPGNGVSTEERIHKRLSFSCFLIVVGTAQKERCTFENVFFLWLAQSRTDAFPRAEPSLCTRASSIYTMPRDVTGFLVHKARSVLADSVPASQSHKL
jgi:hypothetical protein